MEHPVLYVAEVTKFLDRMIEEHGDVLFMGFTFVCLFVIVWLFVRPRKRPVHDFSVVILPLGQPPKRDEEPLPLPFEGSTDF